jgi:hypothetical protein
MFGPSRASRQARRIFSRKLGPLAAVLAACFALGAASDCGFPSYDFAPVGAGGVGAGTAGSGGSGVAGSLGDGGLASSSSSAGNAAAAGNSGMSGSAASAGSGGVTAGAGTGAGAGTAGEGGVAGEGGDSGASGAPCAFSATVTFPAHCTNVKQDSGETGLDCGGPCAPCSGTQTCASNADCASNVCSSGKTCSPILSLAYKAIVTDTFTRGPKFNLVLTYLDTVSTLLPNLRIRYYFYHNQGVAEPVIAQDTQAQYDPGNSQRDISSGVHYQIYRSPPGPALSNGVVTDSYLEITFTNMATLTAGATLNLTQDIVSASNSVNAQFQQTTAYSFINGGPLENHAIAVYRGTQLIWGAPPPMNVLPDCAFVRAVNLNGPAVTSGAQALQASADAGVVYSGAKFQNAVTLLPATDTGTTTLLHSGFVLGNASATWPVVNGKYWAYAWLVSDLTTNAGQLMLQGNPTDPFVSTYNAQNSTFAWARIGPYAVTVVDGSLKLTGTGTVNVAGVELYQPLQ